MSNCSKSPSQNTTMSAAVAAMAFHMALPLPLSGWKRGRISPTGTTRAPLSRAWLAVSSSDRSSITTSSLTNGARPPIRSLLTARHIAPMVEASLCAGMQTAMLGVMLLFRLSGWGILLECWKFGGKLEAAHARMCPPPSTMSVSPVM